MVNDFYRMKATTMTLSKRRQSFFPQDWCARVGLARGSPFEKHGLDLVVERSRAPSLNAAHFRVEVALERVIHVNDAAEIGPTQFCTHCVQNLRVWINLGKTGHIGQVSL